MTPLAFLALLIIALVFATAAMVFGRKLRHAGFWNWSWIAMACAGALVSSNAPGSAGFAAGLGLATLFPALQLAGALEFAGKRVPGWLLPVGIGVAALRACAAAVGFAEASHALVLPAEVGALALGASVALRAAESPDARRVARLVAGGMLLLIAAACGDTWLDWRGSQGDPVPWMLWVPLATPVFALQTSVSLERMLQRVYGDRLARAAAERALDESERRFRALAEHVHDLVADCDEAGRPLYLSPSVERQLGHPLSELRNGTARLLHPDDLQQIEELAPKVLQEGGVLPPMRVRRRDGSYLLLEIAIRAYSLPDGSRRVAAVGRDVTERLAAEERLANARKLESLGVLAGGIAHDFNNLLTGVLGNAELALAELPREHPARELLREIEASSERASDLTQQLLQYSRQARAERKRVDAGELLRAEAALLRRAVPERLRFTLAIAPQLPAVEIDPAQLVQSVHNLVSNAAEACDASGSEVRVEIDGAHGTDAAGERIAIGALAARDYLCIEVCDDGPGFDAEQAQRLFDPFFTTRFPGRGLGLAVVHAIVRAHDGALAVTSSPGCGARFAIYLPTAT